MIPLSATGTGLTGFPADKNLRKWKNGNTPGSQNATVVAIFDISSVLGQNLGSSLDKLSMHLFSI